jgi:predicted nucleic acid-binding Zn ribbon protein
MPDKEIPDDARLAERARQALARAKADARSRGNRPAIPDVIPTERMPGPDSPDQLQPGGALQNSPQRQPAGAAPRNPPLGQAGGAGAENAAHGKPGRPGPRNPARGRARARRDDPQQLGAAIEGLVDSAGWREPAAVGSLFGRWAEIVGGDLAAHTRPDSLADGELTVSADSTAWATQLRLLAGQLVRRLNAELGDGVVRQVRVRGPAAAAGPSRPPGQWRVRGSRGPRDTYG